MIVALRRFFRRFRPRVVEISIVEESTGRLLLRVDEKTVSTLTVLQGHPGLFIQRFMSSTSLVLSVRVIE